jgi:FkbM family methyltransferase
MLYNEGTDTLLEKIWRRIMSLWNPVIDNSSGPLERGPETRRFIKRRRRAKRSLQVLSRLSGKRLATWATRAAAWHGRPDISVRYDATLELYFVEDTEVHAFSHPKRLWTLFDGQIARGKKLAYDYLLDQIDFEDGDNIIDVGANTGDLTLAFRALNRKVNIEAFEPSPKEFLALEWNLSNCSAVVSHRAHQLALWNETSDGMTFYLKPGKADNSILPIVGADSKIIVPSRRLDDVLQNGQMRYRLLKLEAEGAEPEILRGAEKLLPQVDYIAADVGFERGLDADSTLPKVANFLIQHGFEIVGFGATRLVLLFRNQATKL